MKLRAVAFALTSSVILWGGALASSAYSAGPQPSLRVVPKSVAIKGHAMVIATNLPPRSLVTLLFAVPNLKQHRVEQLLGATHSDDKGGLRIRISIPIVTQCGAASMYLVAYQSSQTIRAPFTLTGCKASSSGGKIPPPPTPHKP